MLVKILPSATWFMLSWFNVILAVGFDAFLSGVLSILFFVKGVKVFVKEG